MLVKTAVTLLTLAGLATGGAMYYTRHDRADSPSLRLAAVKRGDIATAISATGTVEPEEVVDVGAQVAGKISALGRDPRDPKKSIDYGSVIQEGTVLALIDDSLYKGQVEQAQASLRRAEADLGQLKAKLYQAEQDWLRAKDLQAKAVISQADYDQARANQQVARANVSVGEAAVEQSRASLDVMQTNLGYTVIKSPVQGVIVDRRVNVGQTVVANLNAPSLFLIAKDLKRMQVWTSVNEADIGRIHPGLPVRFTVDAYPNETFQGKVAQIRLNATMTQNVVTYTVVVDTDNSHLKLLPYLTANVQFDIDQHTGALLVPNAALRWKPRPEQIAPELRDDALPALSSARAAKPGKEASKEERGRVWVPNGAFVRPVEVRLGLSDGTSTEIVAGDLREGTSVVLGDASAEQGTGQATNPFAPRLFGGRNQRPAQ